MARFWELVGIALFDRLEALAKRKKISLTEVLDKAGKAKEGNPLQGHAPFQNGLKRVPRHFVLELVEVLKFEWKRHQQKSGSWNERVRTIREGVDREVVIELHLRKDLPLEAMRGKPMVILDASMTIEEARWLFPDRIWKVYEPEQKWPDEVKLDAYVGLGYSKSYLAKPHHQGQALPSWPFWTASSPARRSASSATWL